MKVLGRCSPSSLLRVKTEIVEYAISNAIIRDGFDEFVSYCKEQRITFLITSGGIDFFIYPLLRDVRDSRVIIFIAMPALSKGRTLRFYGRIRVMRIARLIAACAKQASFALMIPQRYERIIIGDSITDFEGAKLVDTIFARSHLIERCEQLGYAYHPFETFFDIIKQLEAEPVI